MLRPFPFAAALVLLAASSTAHAGRIVVGAPRVESREMRAEARELQDSGVLRDLADALNEVN
jgi:hypothetical protein